MEQSKMKYLYFYLFLFFFSMVLSSCGNHYYYYSPDKTKCLTFFYDKSNSHYLYIVPGKQSNIPNNNYLKINWSDDISFCVDWSSDKYIISYNLLLENKLDSSKAIYFNSQPLDEIEIINGKEYNKKGVECFLIEEISNGSYFESREKMKSGKK